MDAYDADVLIYAAAADHPLGQRIAKVLASRPRSRLETPIAVGSVLLLPELLSKPTREGRDDELLALAAILGRIDLRPLDVATAKSAFRAGELLAKKRAEPTTLPPVTAMFQP